MKDIVKPYNEFQQAHYRLAYSTDTKKRVKATHYCCFYGTKCLTNPASYALSTISLKEFKMMAQFSDKSLLTVKPYKG